MQELSSVDIDLLLSLEVNSTPAAARPRAVVKEVATADEAKKLESAAQLLATHWPAKGEGRHPAQLALAGAMVQGGWSREKCITFLCRVCEIAGEEDPIKRASSVDSSMSRPDVTGFNTLRTFVDADAVDAARKLMCIDPNYGGDKIDLYRPFSATTPEGSEPNEEDPLNTVTGGKKQKPNAQELCYVLSQAPEWQNVFRFNVLSRTPTAVNPPFPMRMQTLNALSDGDVGKIKNWCYNKGYDVSGEAIKMAVATICEERGREYNPFVEYLDSLPPAKGHLAEVHLTVLGVEDPLASVLLEKTLVAAVRRARAAPGVGVPQTPVDHQSVLLLSGDQGAGKGLLVKILAGYETSRSFYGNIDISRLKDKDTRIKVQGCVLVELEEMAASGVDNRDALKRMLSASEDMERPAFGRGAEHVGRTYAMIATTNAANLEDPSGHRRIWPIIIPPGVKIDAAAARRLRDALWSEANTLALDPSYDHHLTPDQAAQCAATARNELEIDDPHRDAVEDAMRGKDFVTTREIYDHVTKGTKANDLMEDRARNALVDTVKELGATSTVKRFGTGLRRGWQVPDAIKNASVSDEGLVYRSALAVGEALRNVNKN